MRTASVRIVDGIFIDSYVLGEIDCTHVYMKRIEGGEKPSKQEVEQAPVYHVAQLKGMADGLYEAVSEWLYGKRELDNVGFAA